MESKEKTSFLGRPPYPKKNETYIQSSEEAEMDPDDISKGRMESENNEPQNELDAVDKVESDDLDVPGPELEDEQENVGSEGEEKE